MTGHRHSTDGSKEIPLTEVPEENSNLVEERKDDSPVKLVQAKEVSRPNYAVKKLQTNQSPVGMPKRTVPKGLKAPKKAKAKLIRPET